MNERALSPEYNVLKPCPSGHGFDLLLKKALIGISGLKEVWM